MPDLRGIPGVPELWELTLGERSVRVALIDGPVDLDLPCFESADVEVLEPTWLPRQYEEAAKGSARARLEHGTWVSSVLFGTHGSDVPGFAPGCKGLVIPSLRGDIAEVDTINTVHAVEAAVEAGADIVLLELCFPSRSGDVGDMLERALRQAAEQGVLLVAGAGNESGRSTCFPAASPAVLAVGAYDDDGRVFGFSNWGQEYDGHGIAAPGANIPGALPGGGTITHKGTSCSGPVAAGVAALLTSLRVQHGLPPDPLGVRRALLRSAAPCSARDTDDEPRRCIGGRLDVPAATELVLAEIRDASRAARVVAGAGGPGTAPSSVGGSPLRGPGSLVFALGTLGYDFGSEARRDVFARFMVAEGTQGDARDERRVVNHLAGHPADAAALTWVLSVDRAPAYAIEPVGPYAAPIHQQLVRLLAAQLALEPEQRIDRVSLPGRSTDRRVELLSGERLAVVEVEGLRGLHGLSAAALATAAAALRATGDGDDALRNALAEFLERVYVDMANLGCTPAQRALNFAATNAYQLADTFAAALARGMVLESADTVRSPVCRLDSDCWDVRLRFFDPDNGRRSWRLFRFAIDVSEVMPVTLGEVRSWSESAAARAAA